MLDCIAAQGFQDSAGATPAYCYGMEPGEPDFAVTLLPESGPPGTRRLSDFPTFAIRVRHADGAEATLFLRRVFEFLQELQGRIGSAPVHPVARVRADATPIHLGRDRGGVGQGRWRVQQQFNAVVRFTTQP